MKSDELEDRLTRWSCANSGHEGHREGLDTVKLCECGCGLPTLTSKVTNKRWGWIKDQPRRFIRGHSNENPWTKEEIGILKKSYKEMGPIKIQLLIKRSQSSIVTKAQRLGIADKAVTTEAIIQRIGLPNPTGLCECGCGKPTPIASSSSISLGKVKGQRQRFIHGHNGKGKKNGRWKGGVIKRKRYFAILDSEHPMADGLGYVLIHRVIAAKALGKVLPREYPVHHHTEEQLVICQANSYHMLLHARTRAYRRKKALEEENSADVAAEAGRR